MKNYGYKICYREQGNTRYVRHFLTYTLKQAAYSLNFYVRYPPTAREDGHVLKKPRWKIIPVNRREILAGIWDEPPF